ncbi:MAG TPA: (deoxy)nucleoside triphosphate pyrophosphohydrolase [Dissulfurispiraceae bacterium]|nr:(deoxy)nucleoside triphosphate pyrophosphohydrolase [Dissulfurispiraceae bacterium]
MKHLHVACAIIEQDSKALTVQRSDRMSLPLKWEFPGGKVEPSELPQDCLRRELIEELGLHIIIEHVLPSHTHNYPAYTVTLYPFVCSIASGELSLHEHAAFAWLPPETMRSLDWAAADLPVIQTYLNSRETTPP